MLDLSQKYWIRLGPLYVKCSILQAYVLPDMVAYPDDPDSIKAIEELEEQGRTVFYDVDEPVGYSLEKDDLVPDGEFCTLDVLTLESVRAKRIEHLASTGSNEEYEYPKKEFGLDWMYEYNV